MGFNEKRIEDLVLWARANATRRCSRLQALSKGFAADDLGFVGEYGDIFLALNTSVIAMQD